jgi:predicted homoserine dehydrogenase-like protein
VILVDRALERRERAGNPIKVGLVGSGFMGRAVAHQLLTNVPGMTLAGVAGRSLGGAALAYEGNGAVPIRTAETLYQLEEAIVRGRSVVTDDPLLLCRAEEVDAIVDATGDVECGARVAAEAIAHGKHVILMNAELDATLGPILKIHAERAGVILTGADGDEPAVAMNLLRFVRSIGLEPVLAGNIKGFYDPYRTPATQADFAAATGQNAHMVTSFADGTKLSLETTLVANATGFAVGKRGMHGHRCAHVNDVIEHFSAEELRARPLVDFVLGAEPGSGAFVVGYGDDEFARGYLRTFKLGDGPLHVFYRPFHLPHLEVPFTVGRAVLFQDAAVTPLAGPVCETVAVAKRDLEAGEALDGIGGFACYGTIENSETARDQDLLPMGLARGCRLKREVPTDQAISYADVELPRDRLVDRLWAEQLAYFSSASPAESRAEHPLVV